MHDDKEIHLECSCHSHALHIERDPFFDKGDQLWYGSFWMRGYSQKDFWWKWRVAWEVLKTGKPYGDEVVLNKEHLQELSDYIQEQLKSLEKK
jgi:hypothetical protein